MLTDMSQMTNAVCFTCGLVIESPARLSRLTNGQICPACRERVLDGLPSALPSRRSESSVEENPSELNAADDPGSAPGPGGWDHAS